MDKTEFIKGVGVGMIAGAAAAFAMPLKKPMKKTVAGKALKAAGDIVENISEAMGI